MPDDNRFAGLSNAVEDEDSESDSTTEQKLESTGDSGTAESKAADSEASDSGAAESEAAGSETTESATDDGGVELEHGQAETEPEPEPDPTAFPFDDATKKTVYVRPKTVDDLEDAQALVDAQLRTDHDVRNLTGREFYDAAFRLAASDTEGLIDEILDARARSEEE